MKYTLHGFSQVRSIESNLDYVDLLILRYFIDFKDTGKMSIKIENNIPFYWFRYDGFISEYPILKIKKDTVYRRMKKLKDNGFLRHITVKNNGTYSYFSVTENILVLLSDGNKSVPPTDLNPKGYGNKYVPPTDLNPEQNNPSTKYNPSIKYINIYNHWNSKKIIVHKYLNKEIEQTIEKALKKYSENEIADAIDIYTEILDSSFYFNYKWSLNEFLNRKNGISTFMDEGSNKANYEEWKRKGGNKGDRSPTGSTSIPSESFKGNKLEERPIELTEEERRELNELE